MSTLRTIKSINTVAGMSTYAIVVFCSSVEESALWQLQKVIQKSPELVVQVAYCNVDGDDNAGNVYACAHFYITKMVFLP